MLESPGHAEGAVDLLPVVVEVGFGHVGLAAEEARYAVDGFFLVFHLGRLWMLLCRDSQLRLEERETVCALGGGDWIWEVGRLSGKLRAGFYIRLKCLRLTRHRNLGVLLNCRIIL